MRPRSFATDEEKARDRPISRRSFLHIAAATAYGALLNSCSPQQSQHHESNQLNIYSWADYIHPDTIPEFQKRYGIRVVYDTFASNESLLAKLQAGATNYDIVVPTSYMVTQLKKLGLLARLDHDRLKLLANIIARFRNPAFDPGLQHCVPYTWGTTGIGFNSAVFASEKDWPHDWDDFWEKRLGGRITLLDDSRETIGMALKRRGQSYNCTDKKQIELALADLTAQKPLTMCYTSDQVIVQLAAGDSWLALAYSGDVYQAARSNSQVRYAIPASGASIWLDNMCIPASAPHRDNAYKWLNFMLEPEIAAATASYTRYATPNALALPMLSNEIRADKNLYPPESLMDKCEAIGDLGSLVFFYDRMWTELKCA